MSTTAQWGVAGISRRWKVLAVTAVAVFMAFLDVTIVNIAFPDIHRDFATTPVSELIWVITGYNVVFAALLVPAGRLADRAGRKRLFLAGGLVFLLASASCGLAPGPGVLIAARVCQAAGGAALVPTSLSLLLPEFPLKQRATTSSVWGVTLAAALGPSLGGAPTTRTNAPSITPGAPPPTTTGGRNDGSDPPLPPLPGWLRRGHPGAR